MQTQFNNCGVPMQHPLDKSRAIKRLRLVKCSEKGAEKRLPVDNSSSSTSFEDVLRKIRLYQYALSERNRTTNPYLQRHLDTFLHSMIEDIQEMLSALPNPLSFSSQTQLRTKAIQSVTMIVRFGVYGSAIIRIHRSLSRMNVEYDLEQLNFEFCAIPGTRQAIEAIVLEFVDAIHTGYITIQENRILNGYAELQKRQLALLSVGGVA